MRIFDNEAAPRVRSASRALFLELDDAARTATVTRAQVHKPNTLLAGTQGNVQGLDDAGNIFVGWGSQGYFTQFAPDGTTIFDARIARGQDTYRAYRFPWVGTPARAAVGRVDLGRAQRLRELERCDAGREWQVLAGSDGRVAGAGDLGAADGLRDPHPHGRGRVRGRAGAGRRGRVLGTSKAISTG